MVSINKVEKGIANYLDAELINSLPQNGFQRVVAGVAISLAIRRSSSIVAGLKDNAFVKMLEIMDDEGNIDIDILREEIKHNIPESGVKVDMPMIGTVTFHKNDVDTLYEYINKA